MGGMMTAQFCSGCGGVLRDHELNQKNRRVCVQCGRIAYPPQRVAVSVIPYTSRNHVVLVRRAIHPGFGYWVIPGGYREIGEDLAAGALRELHEEIRLPMDRKTLKFSGLYSYGGDATILAVYELQVYWEQVWWGPECLEAALFSVTELPWNNIYFPSTKDALSQWIGANDSSRTNFSDTESRR